MNGAPDGTAQFWSVEGHTVVCELCPHNCRIADGRVGRCGVRANSGGRMALPFYGSISSVAIDPIEKKPLYHYHPGSQILSVGFLGCNFHCPFCQNYAISQSTDRAAVRLTPEAVVDQALAADSFAIAYTYNEPSIHFEFVSATAGLARGASLKNVLVTNGHLSLLPATQLLDRMDAVNVDLKSWNKQFYRKELGGNRDAVLEFIRIASSRCHVEVTTLLIPGRNDSEDEISNIAGFLASVDRTMPLHISAYYPTYRYTTERTTPRDVQRAVEIASRTLDYVYPGNVAGEANTSCPSCGNLLIERRAYHVTTPGLNGSKCASCGLKLPIVTA